MTDLAQMLDAAVPRYEGAGDWDAVLRDAGAARRDRRPAFRLAAAVALAALAAVLAVAWPFSGESPSVVDRALAATGDGQVLHVVFESDLPKTIVNLETGERREARGIHEVWFDPSRGLRETETFDGVVQFDTFLTDDGVPEHARDFYTSLGIGYREALESGNAHVVGESEVDGVPVYWIRILAEQGPEGELAHDVAVSRETYVPVSFRLMGGVRPQGGTGETRILTYETVSADDAPLAASGQPTRDRVGVGGSGDRVDLPDAAGILGRTPVWAGQELNGLQLTATRRLDLPTAAGTVSGLSLVYGTLTGASDAGAHVEIKQAATPAPGLTMLVGLHDYVPADGMLVLEGVSGLLRSNGMIVAIHAGDPDAIIAVARALRPYEER
jgi:hypothetical protein